MAKSLNKVTYVILDGEKYNINTDFRVAIECNNIAQDKDIGDMERAYAIVYSLFGEKGLNCPKIEKLLEYSIKYISMNKNGSEEQNNEKQDYELDFDKCEGIIRSSFKFDYGYDPYELEYLHWFDFYNDLENLSTSEFGNCCILNRIIGILNMNLSEIKSDKERNKIHDAQEKLKEKYCKLKEIKLTQEQEKSVEDFYKSLGIL